MLSGSIGNRTLFTVKGISNEALLQILVKRQDLRIDKEAWQENYLRAWQYVRA